MKLKSVSKKKILSLSLLMIAALALSICWILGQETRRALDIVANERESLHPLEQLREAQRQAMEELLSGESMPSGLRQEQVRLARAWAREAKDKGHLRYLILDPRHEIYHLAYLITVKLPERGAELVELAALESEGKGASNRAAFLRVDLDERLAEETRALLEAVGARDDPGTRALKSQDEHRRLRYREYSPGAKPLFRLAAREDFRFWELSHLMLDQTLVHEEAKLGLELRMRMATALSLMLLFALGHWALLRRLAVEEQARAGEVLAQGAQNYEILYKSIPLPVFIYDLETRRFVDANPAACSLLKLPAEEIVGLSLSYFIPPALREAFAETMRNRDLKAESHDFQRIQDGGGKPLDVEVNGRYIELQGRPLRLVMLKDVTEARANEEALVKNEARFRALSEHSGEATTLLSATGHVLWVSASIKNITGYTPEERQGVMAADLVHPGERQRVLGWFRACVQAPPSTVKTECQIMHKTGRYLWAGLTLSNHLGTPGIEAMVLNSRDISAERETQRQLMRFERLAAIGQTAAGLAHEVRNPLAVISTCAQFLRMSLQDRPALQGELDSILRQTGRVSDLVRDVLERSKASELELSEAPAALILENAARAARLRYGIASDNVAQAIDVAEPGLSLRADQAQLERVLLNLILNALQAMPKGGSLTLSARSENGELALEIADNGPGIPEDKMPKIFEPFYTSKETGSGLGLWICKSIVEQHGGRIEASNLRPQGARFRVLLPKGGPKAP